MPDNNDKFLKIVSEKIAAVEAAFAELHAHHAKKATIADAIAKANADEAAALSGNDDAAAVKALLNATALKSVHATRHCHAEGRIAVQKQAIIAAGAIARQFAAESAGQLHNHRFSAAVAVAEATYANQPGGSSEHLARHSKKVIEAEHLASAVSLIVDDVNDIEQLRNLRSNFAPLEAACKAEAGLKLSFPEVWLK